MHLNTEIDMKLGCHCKEHNNQQAVRLAKIVKAVVGAFNKEVMRFVKPFQLYYPPRATELRS